MFYYDKIHLIYLQYFFEIDFFSIFFIKIMKNFHKNYYLFLHYSYNYQHNL